MKVATERDGLINKVDQSEKYKIMCLKAKDLWGGRPFQEGDLMLVEGSTDRYWPVRDYPEFEVEESIDGIHIVSSGEFIRREHVYTNAPSPALEKPQIDYMDFFDAMICMGGIFAWLPTAGQLRAELNKINEIRKDLSAQFKTIDFRQVEIDITKVPFDSLEQTLLNQLMREKFGKVWEGEDWKVKYEDFNPLVIKANHNGAWESVREHLISRGNSECNICHQAFDRGQLHVHHRNGNSLDNRLENLIALCPSCHRKSHKELREKLKAIDE